MGDPAPKVALLAGASGLVGSHLLTALLEAPDFARVYAVTRRPLNREHPRLANRIVRFDRLEAQLAGLACDVAFCCLGTTIRDAGSQQAFRQVDVDHVVAFARAAKAAGARRFVVVSSVGADPQSSNFYLRVKGEAEQALGALGFPSLDIFQPGLLIGARPRVRATEALLGLLMPIVNPLLLGPYARYRAVTARTLAAAMIGAARSGRRGVYRYTYQGIRALEQSKPARIAVPAPVDPNRRSGSR